MGQPIKERIYGNNANMKIHDTISLKQKHAKIQKFKHTMKRQ